MNRLYVLALGGAIGTVFGSIFSGTLSTYLLLGLIVGAIGVFALQSRERALGTLLILFVSLSIGYIRASHYTNSIQNHEAALPPDTYKSLVVEVVTEVIIDGDKQRFVAETDEGIRIRVTTRRYPEVGFAERITLSGRVEYPKSFETETGRVFEYPRFLHARGITHVSIFPDIEHETYSGSMLVRRNLFRFKQWFLDRLTETIPEPHVSLLGGLTVGAQDALGDELLEDFRDTGLIHIVVLSGFNIAIVVLAIRRGLSWLPRNYALIGAALGIVAFALLVGGGATVIRASGMGLIGLLAVVLPERSYDISRALIVTGVAMVLWNPYVLLYDPSFQLSFLATLGLIYFAPWCARRLTFISEAIGLREIISATIATQIFVLPLLLFQSGIVSFTMFVTNILVLPVIPLTMLGGFVTGVLGIVGLPVAYLTTLLLGYILGVVQLFAQVPTLTFPSFPLWVLCVVYVLYVFIYVYKKKSTAI